MYFTESGVNCVSFCALTETERVTRISNVVTIGASGGRIDHNLNAYYIACKYSQVFKEETKSSFYLIGESSCSMILDVKSNNIINFGD